MIRSPLPPYLDKIEAHTAEISFNMASDRRLGSFLRALCCSRPGGRFLELGTGTGHALAWMVDGMDKNARLVSLDNDPDILKIPKSHFGGDPRIKIACVDGLEWIQGYKGKGFDLIFADAWPGKYEALEQILEFLNPGGIYVADDLLEQPNWPQGHAEHVVRFLSYMEKRQDLCCTFLNWSTGVLLAARQNQGMSSIN